MGAPLVGHVIANSFCYLYHLTKCLSCCIHVRLLTFLYSLLDNSLLCNFCNRKGLGMSIALIMFMNPLLYPAKLNFQIHVLSLINQEVSNI